MGIKQELDRIFGVTDEDIDKLILEQKIEEEENKIQILEELRKYKKFEDYLRDHELEFSGIKIDDDFRSISISYEMYPNIDLNLLKKINILCDHFGILIYIGGEKEDTDKKDNKEIRKEKING